MNINDTNTSDTFLPNWLIRSAENKPDHLAILYEDVQWSFAELHRQVTRMARQLAAIGVQEGSRVALLAANGLHYIAFVHALTQLGAVLVPLNTRLTVEELCWQLRDVQATFLINDENFVDLASEIATRAPARGCPSQMNHIQNLPGRMRFPCER